MSDQLATDRTWRRFVLFAIAGSPNVTMPGPGVKTRRIYSKPRREGFVSIHEDTVALTYHAPWRCDQARSATASAAGAGMSALAAAAAARTDSVVAVVAAGSPRRRRPGSRCPS